MANREKRRVGRTNETFEHCLNRLKNLQDDVGLQKPRSSFR